MPPLNMTEQPAPRETRLGLDDDAISLTSTQSEKYASDQEFLVESILAEKKRPDSKMYYLIRWLNYPEEEATWEPKRNIQDQDILRVWKERKVKQANGEEEPYDLEKYDALIKDVARRKKYRHRLRKVKRKREHLPVSSDSSDNDSSEAGEDMAHHEDMLSIEKKAKRKQLSPQKAEKKPLVFERPTSRESSSKPKLKLKVVESESVSLSGVANDPYVGDKKNASTNALQAIREKRAQRGSISDERRPSLVDKLPIASVAGKSRSNSAAEIPLTNVPSQRDPPLSPEVPLSKTYPVSRVSPAPPSASSRQPSPTNAALPITSTARKRGRPSLQTTGNSSIGRGQGVKRGGSVGIKNVFSGGMIRKSKQTLIEQSSDPTKKIKHLSNMHQRYSLQMQGRNLADKAPDLDAIGGLYDPANPGKLPAIRPSILQRNPSSNTVTQETSALDIQPNQRDDASPMDISPDSPSAKTSSTFTAPWLNANIDSHPNISEPTRPLWQSFHGRKSICWYWFNKGSCTRGENCKYYHTNDTAFPVCPEPGFRSPQPCAYFSKPRGCDKGDRCGFTHAAPPFSLSGINTDSQPNSLQATATIPSSSVTEPATFGSAVPRRNISAMDLDSQTLFLEPETDTPPVPRRAVTFAGIELNPLVHEVESTTSTANRKSVSFADRRSSPLVPESDSAVSTRSSQLCIYWSRGDCWRGDNCLFIHSRGHCLENRAPDIQHHTAGESNPLLMTSRHQQPQAAIDQSQLQTPSNQSDLPDLPFETAHHSPFDTPKSPSQAVATVTSSSIPRTKMSMENYRRKRAFTTLDARSKEVFFGSEELQSVVLDFGDVEQTLPQPWGQTFATLTNIQFDQMCVAHDFQVQKESLVGQVLWHGNLLSDPSDQSALSVLDRVSQELRMHSGGLVSAMSDFAILIYPPSEEWNFMEASTRFTADISLRYLIFQTSLQINQQLQNSVSTSCSDYRKTLARAIHKLSFSKLLPKQVKGKSYLFFLLFPPSANESAGFVASWLKESWPMQLCSVYSSQTEGSWSHFVNNLGLQFGIVLIHRSVISQVSELPSIKELLSKQDMVNFWYIDDSSALYPAFPPPQTSTFGQLTAAKIFPIFRNAIFLTPSLFVVDPDKALQIIRWFQHKLKNSTAGNYKLVCSYKIQNYVLDLALDKAAERDDFQQKHRDLPTKDAMEEAAGLSWKTCESRFFCHKYLTELLSKDVADGYSNFYCSNYPNEDTSPIIFADESIDPDDEQALVTWFAFWTLTQLDNFRKFTVVGTFPTKTERARRTREVSVTETPLVSSTSVRTQLIKPFSIGMAKANDEVESSASNGESRSAAIATKANVSVSQSTRPTHKTSQKDPDPFQSLRKPIHAPSPSSRPLSIESMHQGGFGAPAVSAFEAGHSRVASGQVVKNLGEHLVSRAEKSQEIAIKGLAAQMNQASATTSTNTNSSAGLANKLRFDTRTPPQNLEFCALTGSDLPTSKQFLEQSDNDVPRAVKLYYAKNSADPDSTEGQMEEPIGRTCAKQDPRLPHLATTDAALAVEIYSATSDRGPITDGYSPVLEQQLPQVYSPQFNGSTDSRPHSSDSASSVTSSQLGIVYNANGNRFVSKSVRSSGTIRPERPVRSGFIPIEDQHLDLNHRILNNMPQSEIPGSQIPIKPGMILKAYNNGPQNQGSLYVQKGDIVRIVKHVSGIMHLGENTKNNERGQVPEWIFKRPVDYCTPGEEGIGPASAATSQLVETRSMVDVDLQTAILSEVSDDTSRTEVKASDGNPNKSTDDNSGQPMEKQIEELKGDKVQKIMKEIRFEATTEWYGRLKAEGKAWEHIYVDGWAGAFKYLGVNKDK